MDSAIRSFKFLTVTPVLVPAAYGAGDQLGAGLLTLSGAAVGKGLVRIDNITVIDNIKQSIAVDLLFFSDNIAVASSDNAAADVTDALMKTNFLGSVSFPTASYIALNANSYCNIFVDKVMKSEHLDGNLYVLPVTRGTPTYDAAGNLSFRICLEQLSRG